MINRRKFTRRQTLGAGAALAAAAFAKPVQAQEWEKAAHGVSVFGELKEAPGFKHFAYVNPNAPKGGDLSMMTRQTAFNQAFNTFNTLNMFILKGEGAAGMDSTFDTLMSASLDEPDAAYGLLAEKVLISPDKRVYRFLINKAARWHDGTRITAQDVAWTFGTFKTKGHPSLQQMLKDMASAEAESDDVFKLTLKPGHARTLIMSIVGLPVLSKAYYAKANFEETTLEPPLGSSGYRVGKFEAGRFIEYERVADYWAKDLNVNLGTNNFDRVRYQYYRDRDTGFEGFKARDFNFREEFTSLQWATRYDFPAMADGRVKREEIANPLPQGPQMFWFNMRRKQFKDRRIREALGLCFDFEWMNANLMYSSYKRMHSFFENSDMKAKGAPSPDELKILEPLRGKIHDEVFGEAVTPPVSDKSGQDRALLRRANQLLTEAGCKRDGSRLLLPDGAPFTIEFLEYDPGLDRHMQSMINMLKLVGIEAQIRRVDAPQFQRRTDDFDYDVISRRLGGVFTPGEALKFLYGSEEADRKGGRNASGLKSEAVDKIIDIALAAETRENLDIVCRALDRALRAERMGILCWYKATHWYAYWDMFGRPETQARYGTSAPGTWWHDAAKAKRVTG